MGSKILITGGLGYIGGRVSQYLAKKSSYILRISTRNTSESIPNWLGNGELVNIDLSSEENLNAACSGVDSIIHLAAINEIDCFKNPELGITVNSLGTMKLLGAAIEAGVRRFIYISTAHVYGSPLTGVLSEENLVRPQHPYAISHKMAEDFVLAAHDTGQIDSVVLRLSNGFGCPERENINRWTLIVNDLCRQAVTRKKLVLNTSGMQMRDFITLEDISRAIEHVLLINKRDTFNGLFNLGGENTMKIMDMANIIKDRSSKVLNLELKIECKKIEKEESLSKLEYNINKIKSTGFRLKSNHIREIDNTLIFCQKMFNP